MAARFSECRLLGRPERQWRILLLPICVLAAGIASVLVARGPLPLCGFLALTGIPCPLCGGTRACAALAAGDVGFAWQSNAGACVLLAVAVVHATVLACESMAGRSLPGERLWPLAWIASLAITLALWCFRVTAML